jgi:hypothetical protein
MLYLVVSLQEHVIAWKIRVCQFLSKMFFPNNFLVYKNSICLKLRFLTWSHRKFIVTPLKMRHRYHTLTAIRLYKNTTILDFGVGRPCLKTRGCWRCGVDYMLKRCCLDFIERSFLMFLRLVSSKQNVAIICQKCRYAPDSCFCTRMACCRQSQN